MTRWLEFRGELVRSQDIVLGTGDLTLNVTGSVSQTSGNLITASGLLLLGGGGSVTLNEANNVATLAADYTGTIAYTDADALLAGTVTDGPSGMSASGIQSHNNDVKLTTGGSLTIGES